MVKNNNKKITSFTPSLGKKKKSQLIGLIQTTGFHYSNPIYVCDKLKHSGVMRGSEVEVHGRRSYSLILLLMCDSLDLRYLLLFFLIW